MAYSPNNQRQGQEQPFHQGSQQESGYGAAPSAPAYSIPSYGLNEEYFASSQPQGDYSQGGYGQAYAPQQYPPFSSPPNEPPYYPPRAEDEARQYGTPSSTAPIPSQTNEPPATNEDRGVLGAVAGGAAGAYAGHKMHHGFLGGLGGAYAGHKLEQMYGRHNQKPPSPQPGSPPVPHGSRPGHRQPISDSIPRSKGNFSASAREIRLEGDFELVASVRCTNGSERVSRIDLNSVLSNDNGRFHWVKEGGNFATSAREVHLAPSGPPELRAELKTLDGKWVRASVRLDEEIENQDGNLRLT